MLGVLHCHGRLGLLQPHRMKLPLRGLQVRAPTQTNSEKARARAKAWTKEGPGLGDFVKSASSSMGRSYPPAEEPHPYLDEESLLGHGRKVYVDVHGCQMNVSDAEVVWAMLKDKGYERTTDPAQADAYLVVTCSIREGAEQKVMKKLLGIRLKRKKGIFRTTMRVGVLGCMAERLKDDLLGVVDLVAGPDAYRDLPRLLAITNTGDSTAINVALSLEETYADVSPVRLNDDAVTGFVSIQRGCDNMCSYCIVPFTRGRERSRPLSSILDEVSRLADQGVKEVTLLGQNVNSYRDMSNESVSQFGGLAVDEKTRMTPGFSSIYRSKKGGVRFADLLDKVSSANPGMRIRFTSPHPKDFPEEVLHLIAERTNICNHLHLPAQSGSSKVLEAMRRGYTREAYLELVERVRTIIPNVLLSTDMIAGFCGETDEDFQDTVSLIKAVKYHQMYMFPYSLREKTHAHRRLSDDVPEDVKKMRFQILYDLFREEASLLNKAFEGTEQIVLVEGNSKRSSDWYQGRADGNLKVNFPKLEGVSKGDFCRVNIKESTSQTLKGECLWRTDIHGRKLVDKVLDAL